MTSAIVPTILHGATPAASTSALTVVLTLGALGSVAVLVLALAAFRRRRSLPYLLVALAVAALATRAVVGALTMGGYLGSATHHVVEHGLDVAVVALVVGAVYYARTVERQL